MGSLPMKNTSGYELMKTRMTVLTLVVSLYAWVVMARDRAQFHTIAFDGLAFLRGDFGNVHER